MLAQPDRGFKASEVAAELEEAVAQLPTNTEIVFDECGIDRLMSRAFLPLLQIQK